VTRVEVFPAARWADRVAALLAERFRSRPGTRVSLPTGSTPIPVYERVPAALAMVGATTARATIVALDEFLGLPPGHPARCDAVLRRALLDRLDPAPGRSVPFEVDGPDPAAACAGIDATIRDLGGLDLVVLGLGANGHIGMNEPGSSADSQTRIVDLAPSTIEAARRYGADPPPTRGVTLGMAPILGAPEIWLLVSGEHKRDILRATFDGAMSEMVPASLLRDHPGLRVLVDEPAAGRRA
jgi:glucosamine-6-phosphate deaminase